MKIPLALLLLAVALIFSACASHANRRELYRPTEGKGYWTDRRDQYERHEEGLFGVSRYRTGRPLHHTPGVPD